MQPGVRYAPASLYRIVSFTGVQMKSAEVRQKFIEFFKSKEHTFVSGSSTIPIGDQTILFTIAGMTQFKAALTGEETRSYKRAVNSQKCIRIGDLDDVGKDGRHCTMFEMLGSWSFGDYYKKEAISWAYELALDVMRFDKSKLWVTVHHSDEEAAGLWEQIGMTPERIVRLGDKDNFWAMGPTGPCGPCSELYLDQGEAVGKCTVKNFDCKAGPGCDCDRYLEFWNLVFMQFDRKEDGTLVELPFKSVDTGAGLERVTALLQNKTSAFDIDSFDGIKRAIRLRAGIPQDALLAAPMNESMNVIADHIRTLTFTLADGANFGAEGRGYVLRRVLRRAIRHAHKLNPNLPRGASFLAEIVPAVVEEFGKFYPEVAENKARVMDSIRAEEARFVVTLEGGLAKFNTFVDQAKQAGLKVIKGSQVFSLHDTFGFPSDLTRVLCEEIGFQADLKGFEECMRVQKEKSRADAKFYKFDQDDSPWVSLHETGSPADDKNFCGYGLNESNMAFEGRQVHEAALQSGALKRVRQLKNVLFEVVLANTPFYPEGGGQVADSGWLRLEHSALGNHDFEIVDVRKTPAAIVHVLRHGEWSLADSKPLNTELLSDLFGKAKVKARIDLDARLATARNHTATHLLHKALRDVFGDNVRQAGSLVNPLGLRFDFASPRAASAEELTQVEVLVNREILRNVAVNTHVDVKIDDAKRMGAVAIFDEKYDDLVRVLEIPGFSMELCGGTHVARTGDIGMLKILSEGSVTSGVRRIEGVTGTGVYDYLQGLKAQIREASDVAKCAESDLVDRVRTLREGTKDLEKTIASLQSRLVNEKVAELLSRIQEPLPGLKLIAATTQASDVKELELLTDRLKERFEGIIVLGATIDDKAVVLSAVNPTLSKTHKALGAGALVKAVSELVGGKGGGRADFARGGGSHPAKLPEALANVENFVRNLVNS